jgi:hypothetical protein
LRDDDEAKLPHAIHRIGLRWRVTLTISLAMMSQVLTSIPTLVGIMPSVGS